MEFQLKNYLIIEKIVKNNKKKIYLIKINSYN